MAEETISTRIVANADFSALIADVHKVTSSLSKLQQELASSNKMLANQIAVMNRSFSDTLRSTGQYSSHFVSLQSDVEKFGKNLDGGKLKLNQYFNTFRDHARTSGGLIRELAKQQVALQNSVLQPLGRNAQGLMQFNVHVPRGLDEIKNKTAIVRQEMQILNKVIQDGASGLINWGKNTQWAGRQLTVGLTVPLVAFGAQAAKAFREADQELVRLTKVYGDVAGTSSAELGRVRKEVSATAKEISSAMGVSFKETIGLAADIAATGKTGDELLGSIKETTRLAVLGEVDRQEAMKATLAIQSAFKQNTDELSESINFLNAVENQTSTTLNDLVEAIPKAGPVIQGLGGSVQDLALYLTAMREGGINASEGANALKSALASLINPTDVAVGKFQALGIDLLGIVNNNAGNLTGTLMALQGALDNLDPLQKQQAIEQLFGKFQFSRLNALFENLGRQGSQTLQVLDLMKASTGELASVADRELAAVTESASGKYRRAIESLRASLAEVGEQFLQINTVLIQVIDKVVQFANNLPGPVKQVLALAGGFTAVIGPVIMLTGVLANFFGYILKGIFHMKAFFKGGEGWKYLTPEMLAAEKAGKLVEQTFYSDAKAAAVLKQALGNLIDEFSILEAKAKSGATSVNPSVSTMAGNLIIAAGGQRTVNPQHPLAGEEGTRASSHMVPRSGMTEAQKLQQTMFGMVPGSIKVNQKLGQNPQIYMNEDLPNVPGLTTIKGVSTGIVSGEAARWHAMMATLGMQSKAEIEALKKTITATQTVSKEFMMQFDDILPAVNVLTNNAATESALIVAELRAGKINLDAARAKIVALNLETERLIAATVQAQATAMGRTINPTMIPTLNQPVVGPTGKSNMRELFKKGKTKDFINKVAESLGVRTSGAGYNIETTIPKKMNTGGKVFYNNGDQVPGSGNTDTVPAMLTPGEFVIRKGVAQQDPEGMRALNDGQAMIVPVQKKFAGGPILNLLTRLGSWNRNRVQSARRIYGNDVNPSTRKFSEDFNYGPDAYSSIERKTSKFWSNPFLKPGSRKEGEVLAHVITSKYLRRFKNFEMQGSAPIMTGSQMQSKFGSMPSGQSANKVYQLLPDNVINVPGSFNTALSSGSATGSMWLASNRQPQHLISLISHLLNAGVPYKVAYRVASRTLSRVDKAMLNLKDTPLSETKWGNIVDNAMDMEIKNLQSSYQKGAKYNFNQGGMVPGYMGGGGIKMPPWIVRNNAIQNLANTDPLHGPLQIGKYRPPLSIRNRRQGASISYGGNYRPYTWDRGPRAGETIWTPGRSSNVQAFLTGSQEERGRYVTEEYMRGNYSVLSIPGATEAMRAFNKKASGTFHRGITLNGWSKVGGQMPPLPQWLMQDIKTAQATGNFSNLVGKEFIMRRSSWSSNAETAKGFGDFQLVADVKNRNVTPASKMFPELDFMSPGANVKVNESESIFGGKFRIVGAGPNGLKIETVSGPMGGRRAMGGSVSSGMPYVVGENGPEVFVPRNSGGIVPNVQYMQRGGMLRGILGGAAVGIGGQMLGNAVGGGLGTAISMGSMIASMGMGFGGPRSRGDQKEAGFFGRQMSKISPELKQPIGPLNSLSKSLTDLTGRLGGVGKMFGPLLKGFTTLLKLTSPLGIAITAATTAIGFFVKAQKEKAAALEIGRQAFGMDAEAATKAGFKYTDYNAKIKEAIENAQALKERNVMIYESMTKASVPINLTIEQYKKLKEQVKETMGSYIDLFSQTERKDVGQVALQLKAQFMAAGDSAEVATAKIFTMIKQSENANMAASAISSNAFQSIQNMEQASAQTVKTYQAAMKTGDAESQAKALHTVFMAMDASIASVVEEQKKLGGTGEEAAERVAGAIKSKVTEINNLFGTQANLSKDVISEIGKADPLLAEMLNDTDTLNSAWAKYRLTLSGVTMNFQFMSGEAAIAANQLNEIVKAQVQINPAVKAANAEYGKMTARIKDLEKAQKGQSVKAQYNAKEESKRLQEQIAQIKKAAQDKIDGIRRATEAENTQLEIQKAQLRASQALIQGNMNAYAEEQLTVEQLMNEANRKDAEEAIIAKAEIDIKPLQDALDAIADKQEAAGKKAALAGESLAGLRSKADDYNSNLTQYTTNLTNLMTKLQIEGDKFKLTKEFTATMTALETMGKNLGIKTTPQQVLDQIGTALSKNQIVATEVNILTGKIRDGSITGSGTRSNPFNLGAGGSGAGTDLLPSNELSKYGKFGDFGPLGVGQQIKKAAAERGIEPGSYFSIKDKDGLESIFYVEKDGNITRRVNPYEKKSLGGQFAAGDNLLVNDRKNALGTQMEGIAISPNFSGTIYPNAATMPRFNIPSGTKYNGIGGSTTSNSSNVYNIDIALNGTNVTADDVINRMKREMALINAKEGINRRVGA